MFFKSAKFYDYFKVNKNYKLEAEQLRKILLNSNLKNYKILEIACGTGEHIKFLKNYFEIEGMDINPTFVSIAKEKNPECNIYQGDMRNFSIKKKFDVILCLYGAIGYLVNTMELIKVLGNFKNHLNDNGVIIIEPWFSPNNWLANKIHNTVIENEAMTIVRMGFGSPEGKIKFHYLVGKSNGIEHFIEEYEFALFTDENIRDAYTSIGLKSTFLSDLIFKKGIYINNRN